MKKINVIERCAQCSYSGEGIVALRCFHPNITKANGSKYIPSDGSIPKWCPLDNYESEGVLSIYTDGQYHPIMKDADGNCLACSSTKEENASLWTDSATSYAIISGDLLLVGDRESKEQHIEIAIGYCPVCHKSLKKYEGGF